MASSSSTPTALPPPTNGAQQKDDAVASATAVAPDPTRIRVRPKDYYGDRPSDDGFEPSQAPQHGQPELVNGADAPPVDGSVQYRSRFAAFKSLPKRTQWMRYVRTKDFWLVLLLGQVLSLCITGTNTFTTLLANDNTSIPAFQTLFNYVLLNIVFTSYTIYRYGFRKWGRLVLKDGWRYILFAFCDVEGNYFTVLAYRYTTILSAQLINFWAIVMVVLVSLIFLHRRYKIAQYLGILICIGGMGLLMASDHITGQNASTASNELKGDLFALLGATFYGLGNIVEEFAVSKRPVYEVIGQLAFYAMIINGVQAAIFDRGSFATATWNSAVGGYLTGYTLILSLFYTLAPLMFRLSSAAFFNISLLTANFWGLCVGVQVFHLVVHWLYPVAFVLIIFGLFVYFVTDNSLGEAFKPWLGENQERGVAGLGTARRRVERAAGGATDAHDATLAMSGNSAAPEATGPGAV